MKLNCGNEELPCCLLSTVLTISFAVYLSLYCDWLSSEISAWVIVRCVADWSKVNTVTFVFNIMFTLIYLTYRKIA